jgi:hypothetical protein
MKISEILAHATLNNNQNILGMHKNCRDEILSENNIKSFVYRY